MFRSLISKIGSVLSAAALLCIAMPSASGVEPIKLNSNFTDAANLIDTDTTVEAAVNKVSGKDLWVVLVDDLDGLEAEDWAKKTFKKSGLQKHDGLVVIAAESREIGYWANNSSVVSPKLLANAIDDKVRTFFQAEKWDAGIILLAENVQVLSSGGSLNSLNPVRVFVIIGIGGAIVAIIVVYVRWKKKKKQKKAQEAEAKKLQELSEKASRSLLSVDDAVRSATTELEFARAEFGLQATQDFAATLNTARTALNQGFTLRRLLEDPEPETPQEQLQMNTEILRLTKQAEEALHKQQKEFRELRNLSSRAEQKIAELETRITELQAQLPLTAAKIDHLALKFPESMLQALRTYPAQIEKLLDAVKNSLSQARQKISGGERNLAIPYVQMAEETLNHTSQLFERIDAAPAMLGAAEERFKANIASLTADIEDANRLGAGNTNIENAKANAIALISEAQTALNPDYLAFNEQLQKAEVKLDTALEPVRQAEQVQKRLRDSILAAKQSAEIAIDEAENFINHYRSGIDANARTLLVRAKTKLANAATVPLKEQLKLYQKANSDARKALKKAEESMRNRDFDLEDFGGEFLSGMIVSSVLNGIFNNNNRGNFDFGGDSFSDQGGDFNGGRIGF